MNLPISASFLYLLLTAFVWSSHTLAEEEADGHWFRNLDNAWCLIKYEHSEFCLPTYFELQRFETGQAQFAVESLQKPISLISYESGLAEEEIEYLLSDDFFLLTASYIVGDIVITRIEPQESKRDEAHGIVLSIVDFDGQFFLTINSNDQATHRVLIESLTTQWRANKVE